MGLYNDEFDGVGGTYLVDPNTGKRVRMPEGGEQPAGQAPGAAPQRDTVSQQPAAPASSEAAAEAGMGIGPAGGAAKSPEDHETAPEAPAAEPHADV